MWEFSRIPIEELLYIFLEKLRFKGFGMNNSKELLLDFSLIQTSLILPNGIQLKPTFLYTINLFLSSFTNRYTPTSFYFSSR